MPGRNYGVVGTTKRMNNGQLATVTEYFNSHNMTVEFEDGTVVTNVYKVHFDAGKVYNPGKLAKERIGQVAVMSNGEEAYIVRYRKTNDIDIRFKDGTEVCGVRYGHFVRGAVAHPHMRKYQSRIDKASVVGEIRMMNCGLYAECVAYRDSSHLDVEFEDGSLVINRSKSDFKRGQIVSPLLPKYIANRRVNLTGETAVMNCGMLCEVIEDCGCEDITVRFEDGTVVEHRTRSNFRNGNISNPNEDRYSVLCMSQLQHCGMYCECIEYINATKLTVQFEDGTIVSGRSKKEFLNGTIQNPKIPRYNSLPQSVVFYFVRKYFPDAVSDYRPNWLANPLTGYNLELDIWISSLRVGIEYDGYIKRHLHYSTAGDIKGQLIQASNDIDCLLVFHERGTFSYAYDKYENVSLNHISKRSEYPALLDAICSGLTEQFASIGVNMQISPEEIDVEYRDFDYSRFIEKLAYAFDML